jgi:predicted transposase/invertase (TIGR01784 family)
LEKDDIWLRDLTGGLNAERLKRVMEESREMPKGSPLSAYVNMVLRANPRGLQEVLKMSDAALESIFEEFGLTEKWIEQGIEQGEEKAKLLIAKNLVTMGWKIEDVARATELDVSKIQPFYN